MRTAVFTLLRTIEPLHAALSGNSADCLRGGLNGRAASYAGSEAPRPAPPPDRDPPLAPLLIISPGTYVPPLYCSDIRASSRPLAPPLVVALSRALSTTPHAAALTLPQPPLSRADALLLLLLLLLLLQLVLLLLSLRLPFAPAAPALLQLPQRARRLALKDRGQLSLCRRLRRRGCPGRTCPVDVCEWAHFCRFCERPRQESDATAQGGRGP